MSKNTTICMGAEKIQGTPCTAKAKHQMKVYVKGTSAYRLDKLPQQYVEYGHSWETAEISICGNHYKWIMSSQGNIRINNYKTSKETVMDTLDHGDQLTIAEDQGIDNKEEEIKVETKRPKFTITCKDCEQGWHKTLAEVAECRGINYTAPVVNQPLLKNTPMEWKTDDGRIVKWFPTRREADVFNATNRYGVVYPSKKKTGFNVFPTSDHMYGNNKVNKQVSIKCGKCGETHTADTQALATELVRACYAV